MKIENDCKKIEIEEIDRNIKENKILPRLSSKQKKTLLYARNLSF
jgi:hypothetical protein